MRNVFAFFSQNWEQASRRLSRHERLAKEELIRVEALIEEVLPDGRFRVALENGQRLIVYTSGKLQRYRLRSLVGDKVQIEMSLYDKQKGRLVQRERPAGANALRHKGNRR